MAYIDASGLPDPLPFRVAGVGSLPGSPRHGKAAPPPTASPRSTRYVWNRSGMWVEEEPALMGGHKMPTAPKSGSTVRRGSHRAHMLSRSDPAAAPLPKESSSLPPISGMLEGGATTETELWTEVVLPAVTWLYGWVEWQVDSRHHRMPSIVEREHRTAFSLATERVADAIRATPDRLAACIWRAMVALLSHFVERVYPVFGAFERMQLELQHTRSRLDELLAARGVAVDAFDQIRKNDHPNTAAEAAADEAAAARASLQTPDGPRAANVSGGVAVSTLSGAPDASYRASDSGRHRRLSSHEFHSDAELRAAHAEIDELKQKLLGAQRDLLIERNQKAYAEQRLSKQKAVQFAEGGGLSASSAPGAPPGLHRQNTLRLIEDDMVERLEAELDEERKQRRVLEKLKKHLAAQMGDAYMQRLLMTLGAEVDAVAGADEEGARADARADVGTQVDEVEIESGGAVLEIESGGAEGEEEGDDEGVEGEEASSGGGAERRGGRKGRYRSDVRSYNPKGQKKPLGGSGGEGVLRLQGAVVHSTIRIMYDAKLKRDAVDELEHRTKVELGAFVLDWYSQRHGIHQIASKHLQQFREGVKSSTVAGSRRTFLFGAFAGYFPFWGDTSLTMREPATLQFFLDFERKAVRAAGGDERTSEDSSIWLPIDRAVELMRNEFRNARAPDIAKATLEIEDLVRLPNEIVEYSKRLSSMMAAGESSAKAGAAGVAAAKADVSARLSGCTVAAPSSAASAARSSAAATAAAAAAAAAADSELYAGLEPALASSLHSMLHDRQGLEVLDQKGTDEKEKVLPATRRSPRACKCSPRRRAPFSTGAPATRRGPRAEQGPTRPLASWTLLAGTLPPARYEWRWGD
jgi:hypothetical protein